MQPINTVELLKQFVSQIAPPGEEDALRNFTKQLLTRLGVESVADAAGNLIVGDLRTAKTVVTAHFDEIAWLVTRINGDGTLGVTSLGGTEAWKQGESEVIILAPGNEVPGILGFGSAHSNSAASNAIRSRNRSLDWSDGEVFTGRSSTELNSLGVMPGTRIVLARSQRSVSILGSFLASRFIDDRALMAVQVALIAKLQRPGLAYIFTANEEVGCLGALFALKGTNVETIIALEIAPNVPEGRVHLNANPVIWAKDSMATVHTRDLNLVRESAVAVNLTLGSQVLAGGSDATYAARHGLCARHITLGVPVENSHGIEIMHMGAMDALVALTSEVIVRTL
jgi:putative aminopeptidase FrvX